MSGGGSGSSGSQTSTQTVQPWGPQQQFLTEGFNQAQNLLNSNPQMYQGSMTLPYSPETETGLDLITTQALTGSPVSNAYKNQLSDTLNGNYYPGFNQYYTDPTNSPGFQAAMTSAANKIIPSIDSTFNAAGRGGSGLADQAKASAISDSFANLYQGDKQLQAQNYNDERTRQLQASMLAPQETQQEYGDFYNLLGVGQMRDQLQQQALNEQVQRNDYSNNIGWQQLQNFMNIVNGNFGSTGTQTTPLTSNQGAGVLGGALGGASLASTLGASTAGAGLAGPWGLALGAVGGGLLGGVL